MTPPELEQHLPFLFQDADAAARTDFHRHIIVARVPAGDHISWEGDACRQLALVLSGQVRVYKLGENGREITLYRIRAGGSCILTASCILSDMVFPALAVVEEDAQAALVPAAVTRRWLTEHAVWRNYVFGLMSQRLADVIATVEEVAFRRMDARLADYLLAAAVDGEIHTTHQAVADELGTAREVVSRLLKEFEGEQLVGLSRGSITVRDAVGLRARAKL